MKQGVLIKGNKYGITVNLDSEMNFEDLLLETAEKFRDSASFFKDAKVALSIEGRELTRDEEKQLISVITDNSDLTILCILTDEDDDSVVSLKGKAQNTQNNHISDPVNAVLTDDKPYAENGSGYGEFYQGTLRSGQVMESDHSIIILGDVNPGAKVIAKGNIVILGSLKGYAFAGTDGNIHTFVAALEMNPMQIRIGEILARNSDDSRTRLKLKGPHIAFVSQGNIYIEEISRDVMSSIHIGE